MNIEDDKEGFYSVFLNNYTDEEVNTFVKCTVFFFYFIICR